MDICNILVVEDDPDINKLLCRILEGAGYACRPAFSGSEAALWAGQYEYDLVLLDLMLPGLTGEEFIAQMRQKKTMPIIVLSAKAGLEDRVNVLRLGADDFIPKPFDNAEVLARVEAQLRRYKQFSGGGGSAVLTHGAVSYTHLVVFVLPLEQPQQGGLAPAVAPHQTQPPVGIQLQAQVLKDIVVAAGISKGQIPDVDQSHDRSPQIQNMGAEGFVFRAHVPKNGYHKGKCTA